VKDRVDFSKAAERYSSDREVVEEEREGPSNPQ
jgi:hypothetical protein